MEFLKFLQTNSKIFDLIVQRWTALSYWYVVSVANSHLHTVVIWLLRRIGYFIRDYEYKSYPELPLL